MTMVSNVEVSGFNTATIASGYPMDASSYINYSNRPHVLMPKDMQRAKGLARTPIGTGHDNFLTGITVAFDLTASVKFWVEFERYHFAQIVSSQSTMHRLQDMELDFSFVNYTDPKIIKRLKELQDRYNETRDKRDRLIMLYSCPVGLDLTARVVTNYRQLKTMYAQRYNHTLPEWREFCEWMINDLPSFKEWCVDAQVSKKEEH